MGVWADKGLKAKRMLDLQCYKPLVFLNPILSTASNPMHQEVVFRDEMNETGTSLDFKDKNVELRSLK